MKPIEHGIASNDLRINFIHGTTCLAFKFKEGIIVSVDSRASAGYYIGRFNFLNNFLSFFLCAQGFEN